MKSQYQLFHSQLVERQPLACRIFNQAANRQRLSHAYLLTGHTSKDKYLLSKLLACYLNCERRDKEKNEQQDEGLNGYGCCLVQRGINLDARLDSQLNAPGLDSQPDAPALSAIQDLCRNCRWILQESHPQAWFVLSGEESKSGRIMVEKARALSLELSKVSQYVRIIVIPDATRDCFHPPAANALLKTIEEANSNSLFLLFAPDAASVLATIVSRCQIVPLVQSDSSSAFRFPSENKEAQKDFASAIAKYAIYPETGKPGSAAADSLFQSADTAPQSTFIPDSVSQAMQWAGKLELATSAGADAHFLLDWIVFKEFDQFKDSAAIDPKTSAYLDRLLNLTQTTKDQLDSYVQPKAAFESFALSLVNT